MALKGLGKKSSKKRKVKPKHSKSSHPTKSNHESEMDSIAQEDYYPGETELKTKGVEKRGLPGKRKLPHHGGVYGRHFIQGFYLLRVFLRYTCRLPMEVQPKYNGQVIFRFSRKNSTYITFCISTFFYFIISLFCLIGVFSHSSSSETEFKDMCGLTWEELWTTRNMIFLIVVYSWVAASLVSDLYVLLKKDEFVSYFNEWIQAVDQIEIDVSSGTYNQIVAMMVELIIFLVVFGIMSLTGAFDLLQEGTYLVSNVLLKGFVGQLCAPDDENDTRIWLSQPVYHQLSRGVSKGLDGCGKERPNPCKCDPLSNLNTNPCGAFPLTPLWKCIGFSIFAYSAIGSRSYMMQANFFSRCLTNAVTVWNMRVKAAFRGKLPKKDEKGGELKNAGIRCDMVAVCQDYYVIYNLYKETENVFNSMFKIFYLTQGSNLLLILYYYALMSYPSTCEESWDHVAFDVYMCDEFEKHRIELQGNVSYYSFEDPCINRASVRIENGVANTLLLLFVGSFLVQCIWVACMAFEREYDARDIMLRAGFEKIQNQNDRLLGMELCTSFSWNSVVAFNARYFVIDRTMFSFIGVAVIGYLILLLQFKPFEIVLDTDGLGINCLIKGNRYFDDGAAGRDCCKGFASKPNKTFKNIPLW